MLGAWVGLLSGALAASCVIALIALVLFIIRGRNKEPPSPDYRAVGNFHPHTNFSFDSTSSLRKHLSEV